jgi:pyrroloquinoline-quinone synthase
MLEELYGVSSEALIFLRAHYQEEPAHVRDGLELVADLCDDATKQAEAIRAVRETCDLQWDRHTEMLGWSGVLAC